MSSVSKLWPNVRVQMLYVCKLTSSEDAIFYAGLISSTDFVKA